MLINNKRKTLITCLDKLMLTGSPSAPSLFLTKCRVYWWSLIFSVIVLLLTYCHFSTSIEALENTFFCISALKYIQSAMKIFLKNSLENRNMPTKSLFYTLEKNTCLVMLMGSWSKLSICIRNKNIIQRFTTLPYI